MTLDDAFRGMVRDVVRDVLREQRSAPKTALEGELLTYKQAAARVSVSVSTVKRWVKDGLLATRGEGKLRRVRAVDVEACFASNGETPRQTVTATLKDNVTSIIASIPKRSV